MTPPPQLAAPAPTRLVDLTDEALARRAAPVVVPPVGTAVARPTAPGAPRHGAAPDVSRRSLLHRTGRLASGLLLAVAAVAAVACAAAVVVWKVSFAPVLSPSMQPTFAPGDLIVTRALDTADLEVGQVVVLPVPDAPGQRYVHRITEVRWEDGKPVVRTKGDNNASADAWALRVDSPQVPLQVAAVPSAGRLSLLTQGTALRIGLIALVALLALVGVKRALLD